jgi:4-hydroxybenzoate polyprenyltransferase
MGTNKFMSFMKLTRLWHGRAYVAIALFGFILGSDHSLILPFIASVLLYVSFAFAINNCFDIETDSKGEKGRFNPLVDGTLKFKEGLLFSIALAVSGIVTASILPLKAFVVYLLSIFIALIYSAPPRLKTKPPLDLISHGLFFGVFLFLFGLFSSNSSGSISAGIDGYGNYIPLIFSLFFYSCFLELRNHIGDYASDLTSGTRTSVVLLKEKNAGRLKRLFYILHVVCLLPYLLSPLLLLGLIKDRFADVLTAIAYLLLVLGWIA